MPTPRSRPFQIRLVTVRVCNAPCAQRCARDTGLQARRHREHGRGFSSPTDCRESRRGFAWSRMSRSTPIPAGCCQTKSDRAGSAAIYGVAPSRHGGPRRTDRQSAPQGGVVDEYQQDRHRSSVRDELGIPVTNIPAIVTNYRRHRLWPLLAVARNIARRQSCSPAASIRARSRNHLDGLRGNRPRRGLVGSAASARHMARRGRGFEMKIIYADPRRLRPTRRPSSKRHRARDLLREADFVSLHPQLSARTRH